jgi:hypothetical protein
MSYNTQYAANSILDNYTTHAQINSTNGIACSNNGNFVIAVLYGSPNDIFISNDYGKTFIRQILKSWWYSIAMSGDGKYVYLSAYRPSVKLVNGNNDAEKHIFVSADYANTFKDYNYVTNSAGTANLRPLIIECSNSGQHAITAVCTNSVTSNDVFYSSNYGDNWTPTTIPTPSTAIINNFTMSRSGKFVSYTTSTSLALSSNYGRNWSVNTTFSDFRQVNDCCGNITSSYITGNGKIVFVSVSAVYSGSTLISKGGICISKDFGNEWTKTSALDNLKWASVKSSENGQYIMATASDNSSLSLRLQIYKSTDYGTSWTNTNQTQYTGYGSTIGTNRIAITSSGQCSYFLYNTGANHYSNYVMNNYSYSYTPIKIAYNNTFNFTYTSTLYDCSGTYFLRNEKNETLSTKVIVVSYTTSITFTDINTNSFDYGLSNLFVYKENDNPNEERDQLTDKTNPLNDIQISDRMVINATCFLEGTKILAMNSKYRVKYIAIEKLKPGMLVKTLRAGFVPIKYIGYSTIFNPGLATRVRDQLFKCTKSAYPELIEDLVLTGNHSILVDTITNEEQQQITETLGRIYVTEEKYRLPAFNDTRAVPYDQRGEFRIWNLALENEDYYANYGIYANGLLVETTSCRYIKELSRMTLIDE